MLEKTLAAGQPVRSVAVLRRAGRGGFHVIDDDQPAEPTLSVHHRRVAGPFIQAEYAGIESTPYSGLRRALILIRR